MTGALQLRNGIKAIFKGGDSADCSYLDVTMPCWLPACIGVLYLISSLVTFVCGTYMFVLSCCCRKTKTELLHRRVHVSFGMMITVWGINCVVRGVAFFIAGFIYQGCIYSVMGTTFFAAAFVTLDKMNRVQDPSLLCLG